MIPIQSTNTILYCIRWHETVRFYTETLGLAINFANDWFVEFTLTEQARLSVADAARATVKSSGGQGLTVTLQVADSRLVHAQLTAAGAGPTPLKKRWGATVFYVTDPEGNRLEFWS